MADIEIASKEHRDDDDHDGNKKNNDEKKRKVVSMKVTDHLDDDEDENNNFKKMKKTDEYHGSSSNVVREGERVPDDILSEICLHLPPVSVVRYLFASKNWFLTLSNPFFLRNHAVRFHCSQQQYHHDKLLAEPPRGILICPTHTHNKHPVYLLLPQDDDDDDQEQPPNPPSPLKRLLDRFFSAFDTTFPTSIIVDSCNGLLLYCESRIINTHVNHNSRPDDLNIIVCNPVLNQHKFIPRIDLVPFFKNPEKVIIKGYPHLLFDPSVSLSYKVVLIIHEPASNEPASNEFQLHVYSSETEAWSYINNFDQDGGLVQYWESTFFNGVWFCVRDNDILCLDVKEEDNKTSFIRLPQMPDGHLVREVYYFGECAGQLQLIQDYDAEDHWFPFVFSIMEMEHLVMDQQPTHWIEKVRINIDSGFDDLIQGMEPGGIKVMHPYITGGGAYQAVLLNIDNQKFVSFNIATKTFGKEITIPYLENSNNLEAFPFTPTLFPILDLLPPFRTL